MQVFPGDNHPKVTQLEHCPWQQLQWHFAFAKARVMQRIRLEQRYRRKIMNDSTLEMAIISTVVSGTMFI